ncbi:MAG: CAP domain-containing protein [Rhodobacteraceae bacterium]|nr:CAP domain-containing protein [Paracoccaceae bacterium]
MSIATDVERQMLDLINAARANAGLPPLQLALDLNEAAEDHSTWMLETDRFSHTGIGGSSAGDRMADAGFDFAGSWSWGENIAWQSERGAPGISDDVADLFEALMNSPGHRANILSPNFDYVGIGVEIGEFNGWTAVMVTQKFASTDAAVALDTGAAPQAAAPPQPDFLLDGTPADVSGFGGNQDAGTYTVSDDGSAIRLENNAWKQLMQNIVVEDDTVLGFSFASDVKGEIHGIGFETDGRLSSNRIFQLDGTQSWGIQAFDGRYTTGSGAQEYEIPVGQFFTGSFDRIVLVMDDDAGLGADSTFSDISIDTAPDFLLDGAPAAVSGFGGSQDAGHYIVSDDGSAIRLENNAWKQLMQNIVVEDDTVLRFSFASDVEGEIHGIGFETDGRLSSNRIFQLDGTQSWGIQAFDGRYTTGSGAQEYEIPVGQFFTGTFDRLVLVMDDDAGVGADSTFADISIDTAPDFLLDGAPAAVSGFGGSQDAGHYIVSDDGSAIRLENNAWKQLMQNIVVEDDTVLRFSFASDVEGEIHGIGFETDGRLTSSRVFQLDGTQSWGIQAFDELYTTGSGARAYEIPVGQFFTGTFDRLVLVMDDDAGVGADSTFADIMIEDTIFI